jgi:hypothetical protein
MVFPEVSRGFGRRSAVVVPVALCALVFVRAAGPANPSPSPSPSPIPQGCQLVSPQPEAPLKLNLVSLHNVAKTIVMEKEVFNCYDAQSTLTSVRDVQTFIEMIERGVPGKSFGKHGEDHKSPGVQPLGKMVQADTCIKDLKSGGVSCKSVNLPLGVTTTPLARCRVTKGTYPFPVVPQPTHPVEMSTVSLGGRLVKTVAVEKEVFDCGGQIGDLYLFTEVIELANGFAVRPVATQFEGVMCLKNESTAQLVSCKLFTPSRAG